MRVKAKGSNAERELVHQFWGAGWSACRVAGSGSTSLPSPDVVVGTHDRTIVFECKVTAASIQYFTKKEVDELRLFASRMRAEAWVAVKFNRESWYFQPVGDLEVTDSGLKVSRERARALAFSFEDLTASR